MNRFQLLALMAAALIGPTETDDESIEVAIRAARRILDRLETGGFPSEASRNTPDANSAGVGVDAPLPASDLAGEIAAA